MQLKQVIQYKTPKHIHSNSQKVAVGIIPSPFIRNRPANISRSFAQMVCARLWFYLYMLSVQVGS